MKRINNSIMILVILVFTAGILSCEMVFTTSLLEDLQRDPTTMTDEQLRAAAEAALEAGDIELIIEIYDALLPLPDVEDDPDVYILAADLALAASGIGDLVEDVIEEAETLDTARLEELLINFDVAYAHAAADNLFALQAAIDAGLVTGVEITDDQLASAASGMLLAAMAVGGVDYFINNYPSLASGSGLEELQKAEALLAIMDTPTTVEALLSVLGVEV